MPIYGKNIHEVLERIIFQMRSERTSIDGTSFDAPLELNIQINENLITAKCAVADGHIIEQLGVIGTPFGWN